ncbi:MAG: hypothetical protein IPI81_11425 [Flavobacteriales bacterium]|nr:hypothetical protein [Flavobacteriales bacterium]
MDTVVNFPPLWDTKPGRDPSIQSLYGERHCQRGGHHQQYTYPGARRGGHGTPTHDLKFTGAQDDLSAGLSWNGGNGGVAMYIKNRLSGLATATTVRIVSNTGLVKVP